MWENVATQENLKILQARGMHFVGPEGGSVACGDVGAGRMSEPAQIVERCVPLLTAKRDMQGLRVLVTAGPTCEIYRPRALYHQSFQRQDGLCPGRGCAAPRRAGNAGRQARCHSTPPQGAQVEPVRATEDLLQRMLALAPEQDIVIQAAAPADYRAQQIAPQKLKKQGDGALTLTLVPTPDVRPRPWGKASATVLLLVGFAAETETAVENARKKLDSKHLDMIVANRYVTQPGGGLRRGYQHRHHHYPSAGRKPAHHDQESARGRDSHPRAGASGDKATYAQVIVDIASESVEQGCCTYRVPEGMNIVRGMRVSVPFGPRSAEGYVLGLSDTAQLDESRIKAIRQPLEDYPASCRR